MIAAALRALAIATAGAVWFALAAPAAAQFLPQSFYDNKVHDIREGGFRAN